MFLIFVSIDIKNSLGQRIPLVLYCGHAACEQCVRNCLNEKTNRGVTCGSCQEVSAFNGTLKELRVAFPPHMFLLGLFSSRASEKISDEPGFSFHAPARVQEVKTETGKFSLNVELLNISLCSQQYPLFLLCSFCSFVL